MLTALIVTVSAAFIPADERHAELAARRAQLQARSAPANEPTVCPVTALESSARHDATAASAARSLTPAPTRDRSAQQQRAGLHGSEQ
jgi:hypothetical protein